MKRIGMTVGVEFLEMARQDSWALVNGLYIDGEERILIDGRMGDGNTLDFIRENRVNRYFISHFHVDHASGAWRIPLETACRPVLNETEHWFLYSKENYAHVTGYDQAGLHELVEAALMPKIGLRYMPDLGSYSLPEIADISRGRLQVIPAPGHSPGHYCLFAPDTEAVFAGDLGLDLFGPWYGFPHCSISDFLESIDIIRGLGAKRLFYSHGLMIDKDPDQAFARCREIIETRHAQVLDAWNDGLRTAKEIAAKNFIYDRLDRLGRRLTPVVSYWQECMVKCHLDYAGLEEKNNING